MFNFSRGIALARNLPHRAIHVSACHQIRSYKNDEELGKKKTGSSSSSHNREAGEKGGDTSFDAQKEADRLEKIIREFLAGKRPAFEEKTVDGKRVIRILKMEQGGQGGRIGFWLFALAGGLLGIYLVSSLFGSPGDAQLAGTHEFAPLLAGPSIHLDEFVSKFLSTGEVRRIVFFPNHAKAIGVLQRDAVIDGQKYPSATICVDLTWDEDVHFRSRIRDAEKSIGVAPSEHIPIEEVRMYGSPGQMIVPLLISIAMLYLGLKLGKVAGIKFLEMAKKAEKPKKD